LSVHRLKAEYRRVLRVPLGVALYRSPAESASIILELVSIARPPLLITVGDFVTRNLRSAGLEPDVAVVDLKTLRGDAGTDLGALSAGRRVLRCGNPPGTLTEESVAAVGEAVELGRAGIKTLVVVEGEEDLLALPALALAPPRSLLVYGLWLGAAVAVPCHPAVGRAARLLMRRAFEPPLDVP